jgi:hypothetical protein
MCYLGAVAAAVVVIPVLLDNLAVVDIVAQVSKINLHPLPSSLLKAASLPSPFPCS